MALHGHARTRARPRRRVHRQERVQPRHAPEVRLRAADGGDSLFPAGASRVAPWRRRHARHSSPYFLFVGRLEKIKGVQDIIPAFAGDAGPDASRDRRRRLRGRAAAARGRQAARALSRQAARGTASRATIDGALALIVPSVCYETFGIILIESFRNANPRDRPPHRPVSRRSWIAAAAACSSPPATSSARRWRASHGDEATGCSWRARRARRSRPSGATTSSIAAYLDLLRRDRAEKRRRRGSRRRSSACNENPDHRRRGIHRLASRRTASRRRPQRRRRSTTCRRAASTTSPRLASVPGSSA